MDAPKATRIVVSDKALRELIREILDGQGWETSTTVPVNPVTDPSCAVTDPVNPNFTPQDKTEFGIAMQQVVKNLPDTDMPAVFLAVKKALDNRSEKDEIDAATQAAMVAGSQEAIDAAGQSGTDKPKKHEGKMPTMSDVEKQLRARIRQAILEARGLTEADLPPVKKIPMGVHGGEYMRRHQKTVGDLKKTLGPAVDRYENEPAHEPEEEPGDEEGEQRPKHAHQEIGALGAVGAASFEDIAKEMGMSVSGAKQAVDKALLRFKFLHELPDDDREIMVLSAMVDYIDMLNNTGELTPADVQMLKDHPDMVRELDGFRDYLHNTIRRAMKAKPSDLENPLGEGEEELDERAPNKEISGTSVAKPKKEKPLVRPGHGKGATMASGKKATVDWSGLDEDDQVDEAKDKFICPKCHKLWKDCKCKDRDTWRKDEAKRATSPLLTESAAIVMADKRGPYVVADGVEARPNNPNQTQYKAGTRVNVHRHGKKGVFIIEMPNGEKWTNVLKETTHGSVAAKVRQHKEQNPDLYCAKCLWKTGGGPCPRHGGPATEAERKQMQADLGSHVYDPSAVADWMSRRG